MNLALIGYGKMGKEIEKIVTNQKMKIIKIIDENNINKDEFMNHENFKDVEVIIDFSTPDAFKTNYKYLIKSNCNIVVGTTGWYDLQDKVKQEVLDANIGFIFGSNFSIGVNVLFKLTNLLGKFCDKLDDYDVYIEEAHHKFKVDSPSGTAIKIGDELKQNYKKQFKIHSLREGYINGIHKVVIDSKFDNLKIEHQAKSREGFARGALLAAKWIKGKKGYFDFKNVFSEICNLN